jgi:transcriptional regulator with XRE-family HTH domain
MENKERKMNEKRITLGGRIREAREYVGLTQQQVAEALSLPRTAISDIETGKRKVTAEELKGLADLLKHPVTYFTGESGEVPEEVAALARTAANLSENDRMELLRFARFLEYQSKEISAKEGKK